MKNTQKYFILLLMLILLVPSNIWGQETKKEGNYIRQYPKSRGAL